jgi:hypothetical protein
MYQRFVQLGRADGKYKTKLALKHLLKFLQAVGLKYSCADIKKKVK